MNYSVPMSLTGVLSEMLKQQEEIILEQLSDFVSRGLIVLEEGPAMLVHSPNGKFELKRAVKLVLKDKEYIEKLEAENKKLQDQLNIFLNAIKSGLEK